MSNFKTPRSRRRLAAWLAFGAVGLATGAVWATGIATVSGTNANATEAPAVTRDPAAAAIELFANTTSEVTPLTVKWSGRWGSIAAPTVMFKVNLSDNARFDDTKKFSIATLLAKTSDMTGWASMQLELVLVEDSTGTGTCGIPAFTRAANPKARVLKFDNQDAGVYWNDLDGGTVYCIGVKASTGDDLNGTFLRSAEDTEPDSFPEFITTVDRTV